MLNEFINLIQQLFPSIDPYVQEQTKKAIQNFHLSEDKLNWFNSTPYDYLAQGDIINNIPFIRSDANGNLNLNKGLGILLSNTCSASREKNILFAPLLEISKLRINDIKAAKNNLMFGLMYFPSTKYKEYIIDFNLINSFNRNMINEGLKSNKMKKESSLNQFGYYLLIAKLTVYFMRPEDKEVQNIRRENFINNN